MNKMPPILYTFLTILVVSFLVWGLMPRARAHISYVPDNPTEVNVERLISAIKAVENSPRHSVGEAGERSEYQITQDVWSQHSHFPHDWASGDDHVCTEETQRVMRKHIDWIESQLAKRGDTITPYAIGAIWHAGWGRWERRELRFVDTSYGTRVMNCYGDATP